MTSRLLALLQLGVLSVVGPSLVAQSPPSLGPALHDVTVQYNVMVEMRDGVRLSTDVYRPTGEGRFPVVLVRNPYGNGSVGDIQEPPELGPWWASRGYVYLWQDVRGRYDSEGAWYPFRNEQDDGYDACVWAGEQPWSNGRVTMRSGSYLALDQWQAASMECPYLVTIMPMFSPLNLYRDFHPGGAFEVTRIVWATVHNGRTAQRFDYDWDALLPSLPLLTLDERFGHRSPIWRDWVRHEANGPYWERFNMEAQLDRVDMPVLHIGGWFDTFLHSTLSAYSGMRSRVGTSRPQRLVLGPWQHAAALLPKAGDVEFGAVALPDADSLEMMWADRWLKDVQNGIDREPPIRLFVIGANVWRDEHEWPLPGTRFTPYYLHSGGNANTLSGDGQLSTGQPGSQPPDRFTYDPLNPVPTHGGALPGASPNIQPGMFDQRALERRDDVLVYTTAKLERDVEVIGPVQVILYAATDGVDTDFTAKLVDVYPDGTAYNLTDGIVRARFRESSSEASFLTPGQIVRYQIDLVATANLFKAGHQIRVEISSSNFPRFSRNLNTGNAIATDTVVRAAAQTVFHDGDRPSHVILPIIPPGR